MKIRTIQCISDEDWDEVVQKTYGRPYCFQQQNGCRDRGSYDITVPDHPFDFPDSTIPEKVNGSEMGVSFSAWLARDPKQKLRAGDKWDREHGLELFWHRNFYPDVSMIANDLHARGLLPAGEYQIAVDW